jgi:hypothetical protein
VPNPADRAIVTDNGSELMLTFYGTGGAVARVALDPARAIRLGNRLIRAALPHLSERIAQRSRRFFGPFGVSRSSNLADNQSSISILNWLKRGRGKRSAACMAVRGWICW